MGREKCSNDSYNRAVPVKVEKIDRAYGTVRRMHLTNEHKQILEAEFQRNPNWNITRTRQLAETLGLKDIKIYKWNYDRRRKETRLNGLPFTRTQRLVGTGH